MRWITWPTTNNVAHGARMGSHGTHVGPTTALPINTSPTTLNVKWHSVARDSLFPSLTWYWSGSFTPLKTRSGRKRSEISSKYMHGNPLHQILCQTSVVRVVCMSENNQKSASRNGAKKQKKKKCRHAWEWESENLAQQRCSRWTEEDPMSILSIIHFLYTYFEFIFVDGYEFLQLSYVLSVQLFI